MSLPLHGSNPQSQQGAIILAIVMCVFNFLVMLAFSFCIFLAGYGLRKQRWRTFCFVIAAFLLCGIPIGTILGIYSIKILNKPEIKELAMSYLQANEQKKLAKTTVKESYVFNYKKFIKRNDY